MTDIGYWMAKQAREIQEKHKREEEAKRLAGRICTSTSVDEKDTDHLDDMWSYIMTDCDTVHREQGVQDVVIVAKDLRQAHLVLYGLQLPNMLYCKISKQGTYSRNGTATSKIICFRESEEPIGMRFSNPKLIFLDGLSSECKARWEKIVRNRITI